MVTWKLPVLEGYLPGSVRNVIKIPFLPQVDFQEARDHGYVL